jgi:CHAT domain-containing protein
LLATRDEAAAFARAIPSARAVIGRSASEAAVRRALSSGGIVHVASHGILNAHNPLFTRIELARPNTDSRSNDDGRLEVHEVLSLTVRSPLVFLSGCETSAFQVWLDDPVRGTDHSTLAQAFLFAGATNVAGTLWRIQDKAAAAFASEFYTALTRMPPVTALAVAQRRLLSNANLANPYFWASYLLTGAGYSSVSI